MLFVFLCHLIQPRSSSSSSSATISTESSKKNDEENWPQNSVDGVVHEEVDTEITSPCTCMAVQEVEAIIGVDVVM